MVKKILFLIQNPNQGGLKNLVDRWKIALEKKNFSVDLKIIEENNYNLNNYDLVHLFFSPFYSKKLFIKLLFKKKFSNRKNIILTYYNLKNESNLKLFLRKILVKLTINKLALPSKRMVDYYKNLGIQSSFLLHPIIPKKYSKYLGRNKKYISYFGALRKDKGIDNLLYISDFIPNNIYSAGFKIGSNESKTYLEEIKNNNKFTEFKGDHLDLVSKSIIALFPYKDLSSTIDMPLALLEAMKMGVVVLTSDIAPLNSFLPKECLVKSWKNKKEVLGKIKNIEKKQKELSFIMSHMVESLDINEESFVENYKNLFL